MLATFYIVEAKARVFLLFKYLILNNCNESLNIDFHVTSMSSSNYDQTLGCSRFVVRWRPAYHF